MFLYRGNAALACNFAVLKSNSRSSNSSNRSTRIKKHDVRWNQFCCFWVIFIAQAAWVTIYDSTESLAFQIPCKKLFFHASHSIAVNEPAQLKYATVSEARSACCNSDDELLLESLFKSKTRRTNTKHFFSEEHEAMITSRWCSNSQPIIRNCCRRQHMWLCITALLLFCLHFFLTFFSPTTLPRLFFPSDIFCSGAENN